MTAPFRSRPATTWLLAATGVTVLAGCGAGTRATSAGPKTAPAPTTAPAPSTLHASEAIFALPQPASRMAVVVHGSTVDLLGGLATGDVSTSRVVAVDTAAGSAANVGRLKVAVHDTAGGPDGSGDLVFGGGAATERSDLQRFVPAGSSAASGAGSASTGSASTGSASTGSAGSGSAGTGSGTGTASGATAGSTTTIGHLPAARSDSVAATIGSTTYLLGGFDGSALSTAVLATTDGSDVHQVGTLGQGVRYPAVAVLDGKIYVMGGDTGTAEGATGAVDLVQRFDPATGASTVVGHLPQPVGHAMGAALGGRLWLMGGSSGGAPVATILRIDPSTGTVTPGGSLPEPRSDAGTAVVGGTVWLFGGEQSSTSHPLSSIVELTPA